MSSQGEAFNETSVTSEVDRILKSINVNAFITNEPHSSATLIQHPAQATKVNDSQTDRAPATEASCPPSMPPVTAILATFISSATPALLTPPLRARLRDCILDFVAVAASGATTAPSSEPIVNGLMAFSDSSAHTSLCTVIASGRKQPVHFAALLNATYGHSLDFDDTHAESSLHAGVTSIATGLAEAERLLRSGAGAVTTDELLLAILVGYEVTIRLGVALSTAAYSRGFHNTSTAGIFGSVAVIACLRRLSAAIVSNAFGLAGSKAAGSMQYLANGSHNKRLHPGFAAHDAFLCVSLAEAGVIGADSIIEGNLGFFQAYTARGATDIDWQRLVSELGTRWEFEHNSLKPYAGCRMTHAFIQLADSVGQKFRDGAFEQDGAKAIARVRCHMPSANMILIGQRLPNKIHPENMVDAQFSCYFQVANALLHGGSHDLSAYDRLDDPAIYALCEKIECVAEDSMTRMSGQMDVWFENEDGETADIVRGGLPDPLGEQSNPFSQDRVHSKFMGLTTPVYGAERAANILDKLLAFGTSDSESLSILDLVDLLGSEVKAV